MADQQTASFTGDAPVAATTSVLPDRRELALVAVERTRMPMVVCDPCQPDTPIVLANQAFLDLTGYGAEEVIGRNCRFLQGPQTAEADIEALRTGLPGEEPIFEVELLNYRKDGSTFWNQLSVSPIYDQRGALLYYFGSQKDVSARHRARELEATERMLLMEVDHRAMNALALVKSIIQLTRASTIERFSMAVRGRVDALARAHRLLAEGGWTGTQLAKLIREEAAPWVIATEGPPLNLPARLVQPVALVLHELIANARQHGALANNGHIRVWWEATATHLVLHWQEGLARLPGATPTLGLGLNLAYCVIERQLGGKVRFNWLESGFEAELVVPLSPGDGVP